MSSSNIFCSISRLLLLLSVRSSYHHLLPSFSFTLLLYGCSQYWDKIGPCRLTVPVVKDILKQYSGQIDVVEVCTDDLAQIAEEAGVVSIPTIQFYYKGKALESHSIVGCVAKTVLANAVEKVLEDAEQMR
mmetsp:Transcript_23116/g.54848  ORF Transcript_23116/g.54848 Transcript_23116/m.54848 type:complete len:131 (+) Transcript_23116:775-1167(+)